MLTTGSWGRPAAAEPNVGAVVQNIDKKLKPTPKELPDFNKEILAPLRAKQAEAARVAEEARLAALAASQAIVEQPSQPVIAVAREVQPSQSGNCHDWLVNAGVTDLASAETLIARESGCNPWIANTSSGACGVAQELPCGKSGCSLGNGACQVAWMHRYVLERYGSWANALAHSYANNWY